ncbi:hypothetical protein [Helicobacter rodentium]|nr:hypothetical protein [Helicobacter rodentium]
MANSGLRKLPLRPCCHCEKSFSFSWQSIIKQKVNSQWNCNDESF